MKATLVKFPYVVNTGDECKGPRPQTREGRAILFEGERRQVLFAANYYGKGGEFFPITGTAEDGRPELDGSVLDGSVWDYTVPEGPMTVVEELPFTPYEVRAVLAMPEQQKAYREIVARCSDHVKK